MGDQEYNCELCNVSYAAEVELQDHKWSLMHHIKIEKVKKGAPHSCDLCMTSCSNIIEYGKHLNEDRHQIALARRKKDGLDEPLDSFANIPDTTAELDAKPELDHPETDYNMPHRFNQRVDKHSRSFSQPELNTQDNRMYHSQGNWSRQPQHGPGNSQNYTNGPWPTWNDMIPGFSQSLGSVNDTYRGGRNTSANDRGQYFRDDFEQMNWNDDSFYNPGPQLDVYMSRHSNRGRKGSLDSSFRKPSTQSKKHKNKNVKKLRGRSWDRNRDLGTNTDVYHWNNQRHGFDEAKQEFNDRDFQRPDSRVPERGRGILRGGRGRAGTYDQSRQDKYSPESNSSTDSGGLKRRMEDEAFQTTGKSRRGNESNRIPPEPHQIKHIPSLLDFRPRSRSYDRLQERDPVSMDTDQLSRSTGNRDARKVTWSDQQLSDQQLVVSSTTEPESDIRKPHRSMSLERLNQSKKVKPDSSSGKKKFGGKKDKKKSDRRNLSPEDDTLGGHRASRAQYKNIPKEKTSTDSVLEKAEKLCKKLRNEREKAKQQKNLSEKQKKMSKTEELNGQIEELSRKNREHIKGHLEIVENSLLSRSVSSDSTESSNVSAPPERLQDKFDARLVKVSASSATTKDAKNKDNSSETKTEITARIARTRADIDAIRAKIEGSVQTETGTGVQKEMIKPTDKVDPAPAKSARTPTPSDILSPGMAYSPSNTAQKPDRNALLKMVKSPRSTKERLWLAERLRSHAKSQTKLSLPRFNLKFSDLCTGSERPNDLTDFDISNLAPSVQLEIADIIEADSKPDIIELQKLLDNASAENAELDSNILSELGILQTPSKDDYRPRSVSPMRVGSPIVYGSSRYVDTRPSLSIEELSTIEDLPTTHLSHLSQPTTPQSQPKPAEIQSPQPATHAAIPGTSYSNPLSDNTNRDWNFSPPPPPVLSKVNQYGTGGIKIKAEKMDDGYEKASAVAMPPPNARLFPGGLTEGAPREPGSPRDQTGRALSPVRKSIHTQNFYTGSSEVPERDVYRPRPKTPETNGRSALEKVTAILDGAPSADKALSGQSGLATQATEPAVSRGGQEKAETGFDSSLNSQTSSVLDQVYNISLQEESVRHEINTMDLKIKQLQRLIDEAADQMNRFSVKRKELTEQEDTFRNSRMKLLQESRSQQGSSSSHTEGGAPLLGNLTDTQLRNMNNPLFIKFLMSQRQSDLSSAGGGYSNVETGSQSEAEHSSQRRASITSNSDPQSQQYGHNPTVRSENSMRFGDNQLFSQSINALSGSTDTLSSSHSKSKVVRDSGMPVPNISGSIGSQDEKSRPDQAKEDAPSNSLSLLNTPLDKVGFITLDALLKGDSDIGKLLHKSLESFNKGNTPGQETILQKQESTDRSSGSLPVPNVASFDRERRNSGLSIGSDDMLMSGSDAEKRSGKVSMKYMGTLPDGISYNTLAKQMSGGAGNKTVMFTMLNSPEAMSQLKRASDGEISPQVSRARPESAANTAAMDTMSDLTETTNTVTADYNDIDTHSVKSNYSLGEQIKLMCEGQNPDCNTSMQLYTPRSEESSGEKTLEDEASKQPSTPKTSIHGSPVKDCFVKLDKLESQDYSNLLLMSKPEVQRSMQHQDAGSPVRKRLKSKKERDQISRRKQKESFILNSDTNSEADVDLASHSSSRSRSRTSVSRSEDDLVQSGSEEAKTPRLSEKTDVKKSLLDEVQLETETPSDSCEDRSQKLDGTSYAANERLRLAPEMLASCRTNVKSKQGTERTLPAIEYKGPSLSVAAVQQFQDDLYVCYNGSEVRRFDIKTGEILKELDCSPYLVNTLHVTRVHERQDILYTGGACKKLMLFEPKKFNLIATFDYSARIACLHENWGRLFVGLSDGAVSVRSLKTDKEINTFSCTASTVHCLASTSAGMTKMLCLGTADKIIYVMDAITGLLITMLEGHTLPPLCIQVFGETVLSGAADQTLLVHNVSTGELIKSIKSTKPITSLWTDDSYIYISCCDNLVRCYGSNFKLEKVCYGAGKGIVTSGLVHAGMLITGNRDGLAEAVPLSLLNGRWECKFGGCSLEFTCSDHLKFHVLSDHNSSRASQCTHRDCQYSFPSPESRQDHLLSHLKK